MSEGKTDGQLAYEAFYGSFPSGYLSWDGIGDELRAAWEAAAVAGAASAHERTAELLGEVNGLRGQRDAAMADNREMRHLNAWQGSEIARLRALVRQALEDAGVPDDVQAEWLERAGIDTPEPAVAPCGGGFAAEISRLATPDGEG